VIQIKQESNAAVLRQRGRSCLVWEMNSTSPSSLQELTLSEKPSSRRWTASSTRWRRPNSTKAALCGGRAVIFGCAIGRCAHAS